MIKMLSTMLLCFGIANAWAAGDGESFSPHQHIAGFLGAGYETKRDGREREIGIALGLQYEYQFAPKWGIEGLFELLGEDTLRDAIVAAPIVFHPGNGWRLFAGPGYEFTEKKDKALLRVGAGYEFHVDDHWTLTPEIFADFIAGGATTWIGGASIGYGF
jgi:hypothetical protein